MPKFHRHPWRVRAAGAFLVLSLPAVTALAQAAPPLVAPGPDGRLVYQPDARGNSIPDYSYAGYRLGGVAIPDAPVRVTLKPLGDGKDDSAAIQSALDEVSKLPLGNDGLRGAVLLSKGTYQLDRPLSITESGIVLRGEGGQPGGTVLQARM